VRGPLAPVGAILLTLFGAIGTSLVGAIAF
jgi:hypothetical protein